MTTAIGEASISCASCGRVIGRDESYQLASDRRTVCTGCAATAASPASADPLAQALDSRPSTIVRTYPGRDQVVAARSLETESGRLADSGYELRSQAWAPPERPEITGVAGVGVTLIGLFLMLFVVDGFLLGLVIVLVGLAFLAAYAGNTRPGILSATFARTRREALDPAAEAAAERPAGTARSASERLVELVSLREAGLITDDELVARRKVVLDSI